MQLRPTCIERASIVPALMPALSRQYAKLCAVDDFADPEIAELIPEIAPSQSPARPHRKGWEFAMGALFLRDVERLEGDAEILDIGAGNEEILYWLAQRAQRVVASDIYGEGGFAQREAQASMLEDPAAHAPYDYPHDKLEVRAMDARAPDYPDASFDAVVSFSSIEHFGGPADIAQAAAEVGRVLKPGGHAFLVTELFVRTNPLDSAPVQTLVRALTLGRVCAGATPRRRVVGEAFTHRTLERDLLRPSTLQLMQPLDLTRPPNWDENVQTLHRDGRVTANAPHPHVTVRALLSTWTSLCLPLVKPGR